MPIYTYQASNYTGDLVKESIDAPDEDAVVAHVQAQGLIPVKIKKSSKLTLSSGSSGRKIKSTTLSIFTMELATLLEAGLPLDRSLNILIEMEESSEWRLVLEDLLAKIKSGSNLSQAMKKHNKIFSDFYVGLVHAGELSGSLDAVLDRLADYLEKRLETQSAIKKALFYPAMLITVGTGVVVYLLLSVIPKFAEIVARNGTTDVPFVSDIIFMLSAGLRQYWYVFLIVIVLLIAWIRGVLKNPAKREHLDAKLLNAPLFGGLIRKSEFAKLTRTLGTMLTHGVPLSVALRSVQESVGNKVLAETVDEAMKSLKGGRGMSRVLIESKAFPTLGVQMVKVGEETGKLEKMLMKVADIYDKEVKNSTESIVATIAPIAILTIAVMIALIMIGVVMALFSLS